MVAPIKIVGIETTEDAPCIVCGKSTKHRHAYSNAQMKQTAVCFQCCEKGCMGKHVEVQIQSTVLYCTHCEKDVPADKAGKLTDKVSICPECQEQLVMKK